MTIRGDEALRRAKEDVRAHCAGVTNADDLFERASSRLRRFVPYDGAIWFGTDPATMLATRPVRIENIEAGHCETFWQREFYVEDKNLFVDMARLDKPVVTLDAATGGRLSRSARYREFLGPQGYGDEMRGLLRVGKTTWGLVSLYREKGRPPFTPDEVHLVSELSDQLGSLLRSHLVRQAAPASGALDAPGMLVFEQDGRLRTSNPEAHRWLDQLGNQPVGGRDGLPAPVHTILWHARAVADGREDGPARLRLLTTSGRWLLMHASAMAGLTVVVLERAEAHEIAPMIVDAYDLSPREQQVTALLARGLNTTQIAQELHLSTHTVRDYVKSVFEKVGVSSRGELVALLFARHHEPALHEAAQITT
jgi:DNA-binding CsgD family transcriptional regulator